MVFTERLLIPTGLHHVLNQLIRFTPVGGTAMIDGQTVSGALNIFQALLVTKHMDMTCLYKSETGDVDQIPATELTITLYVTIIR